MSGLDAGFFWYDLPHQPMHGDGLMVLEPSTRADGAPERITLADLRQHVEKKLPYLPELRCRVVTVPLGLDHPLLVEDPDFEIDNHISQVVLPAPGDDAELVKVWREVSMQRLDRNRPLWRVVLVDGLQDGRQAVIYATHHCLGDAGGPFSIHLFRPLPPGVDLNEIEPIAASAPARTVLVAQAVRRMCRHMGLIPRLVQRTARMSVEVRRRERQAGGDVPRFGRRVPDCVLNRNYSFGRSLAKGTLEIDDVRMVKQVAGVTTNDVLIAVVAGGLRRYLQERDALPEQPLIAGILVALDAASTEGSSSRNNITQLATSLATDMDDPWERLEAISQITQRAKAILNVDPKLSFDWLEVLPPFAVKATLGYLSRRARSGKLRPLVNITTSNVSLGDLLYEVGHVRVEEMFPRGLPTSPGGSNITFNTYRDRLHLGIAAFPEAISSPDELLHDMRRALDELVAEASTRRVLKPSSV